MEKTFMINQLMSQLSKMTKSEKYQQGKVMITLHNWLFIRFCLFWKKNYRQIAVDLSKQKALDADSGPIKQIIFTDKMKATEANTRVIIY